MRVPLEWLKDYVSFRLKPEKLADMLTMSGLEVEEIERSGEDLIFELGITPNRADCLSVQGVAREVAAVGGYKFTASTKKPPRGKGKMAEFVKIAVKHPRRCPRYSARIIDGVKIGPSPAWMIKRLADCGIRSINNVVDATNYVLLETGQPMHAFDTRFLRGDKIVVKEAAVGLSFTTLDGIERKLIDNDLMICDGEGPVALAGVMGGENSEVRQSTTRILLESAYFDPSGIRKTSRRLGLTSESSRRFERGVDPNGTLGALHRLTEIILETAGGTPSADWIDLYPRKIKPKTVSVGVDYTNRILGTNLTPTQVKKYLSNIGLTFKAQKTGTKVKKVTCSVPTSRSDLARPIDLIEEVGRLYGYGNIEDTMPTIHMANISRPKYFHQEEMARQALYGQGMTETALYGFTGEDKLEPFSSFAGEPVRVTNPLSQDQGVMRTMLVPGLLDVCKLNMSRQRNDLRIFSLQGIYLRQRPIGPTEEPSYIALAMTGHRYPVGWQQANAMIDFYDIKGAVDALLDSLGVGGEVVYQRGDDHGFLHPGQFANVLCSGKLVGFVGMLHPDVAGRWNIEQEMFIAELNFDLISEISSGELSKFSELSKFPFVERDLSLVLPDRIPAVELEKTISDSGVDLIDRVRIFDVYKGKGLQEGHKSIAISIRYSRNDGTLTDDEVTQAQDRIVNILQTKLGATLRT